MDYKGWLGREGWITKEHKETLGSGRACINLIMVMVSQVYTCVKTHPVVNLKYRQFILFFVFCFFLNIGSL